MSEPITMVASSEVLAALSILSEEYGWVEGFGERVDELAQGMGILPPKTEPDDEYPGDDV